MPIALTERYPMLDTAIKDYADYVAPTDYRRLLKPYVFDGVDDLGFFDEFLKARGQVDKALELGCGTGRATDAFLDATNVTDLTLLDLSPKMLGHSREKYSDRSEIGFVHSDTVTHLETDPDDYDVIYSLWSFSHSVHQILVDGDPEAGELRVKAAIRRMVEEMMRPGAGFFLIHVDSQSEEQAILFQQWAKLFPIFSDGTQQTPSKLLFDEVFNELAEEGVIDFEARHYTGDPIRYESMEQLLDIFLNFHLESHFNSDDHAASTIQEIESHAESFKNEDGSYSIRPGCFIYKVNKRS